jgi:hypothetical protein
MAAGECLLDQVPQVVLDDLGDLAADEAAVAAGAGEHRERLVRVLTFTQHQNSRAVDIEQRAIWVRTPSASRCIDLKSNSADAASMMISSPRRV